MQVVYSGGSSTPTPSPHLPRKNYGPGGGGGGGGGGGYSRPVMPGYTTSHPPQTAPQRPGRENNKQLTEGDTTLRDSIPAMKRPVAIVCFVLNVILPGLGTLVSGLTVLCGSRVRAGGGTRGGVVRTNAGVALLQFLLTFLFLLGWIWSVMWATAFLSISDEYYKKEQVEQAPSTHGRQKSSPAQKRDLQDDNVSSSRHHSLPPSPSLTRDHHHHHHPQSHSPSTSAEPPHPHRNGMSVNVVGGTSATNPALYTTTTTTTPSTSSSSAAAETRGQPIIVLQEAPVIVNHADVITSGPASSSTLMNARTRHEKILRRQMSDNELSPFILTHERLESIVIHDAPVRPQRGPGSSSAIREESHGHPGVRSVPKS